jgi:hypothetical protein
VRFEVTRVLDSIQRRLCTDPTVARAVVDLVPIIRARELDDGRVVNLVRLGLVIDALGQSLNDPGARVYVVMDRALLSDLELTSNEKMVLRRWSDDGLVDTLAEVDDRVLEVAAFTGLPVISRDDFARFVPRHPWIAGTPQRFLRPVPGVGGAALMTRPGPANGPAEPQFDQPTLAILSRYWRCQQPGCVAFGTPGPAAPPPRIRGGRPFCTRHDEQLVDAGPRQQTVPVAIWIGGAERGRFAVPADRPVVVGRAPDDPQGVRLGEFLDDEAVQWVSRSHVRLELVNGALTVTDTSTNGTVVHAQGGPDGATNRVTLSRGQQYSMGDWDAVELHEGVALTRADRPRPAGPSDEAPVMAEAPTVAIRLPNGPNGGDQPG